MKVNSEIIENGCNSVCLRKVFLLSALLILLISGCDHNNRIMDPTQVGRFRPTPSVSIILNELGVEDETVSELDNAEEPLDIDAVVYEEDYVFSSGDVIRISIHELLFENQPYTNDFIVNETGRINIIEVGVMDVAGLTEVQLVEELKNILSPNTLKDPLVTVTLLRSERRMFSIAGIGIRSAGRYPIPRYDFRLLDAIALAGGMGQHNYSYVYVARNPVADRVLRDNFDSMFPGTMEMEMEYEQSDDLLQLLGSSGQDQSMLMLSSEMATDGELFSDERSGLDILSSLAQLEVEDQSAEDVEWEFLREEGKWVPVKTKKPSVSVLSDVLSPRSEKRMKELSLEEPIETGSEVRFIKIPRDKLVTGDPRYNIVIRERDNVYIPADMTGEFMIMGNVNRPGPYRLDGRPITLKAAISLAGGLSPLAQPKHCEIVRRIGDNREETVMVDLDKIYRGEQPDFFVKPLDLINVGTDQMAEWRYKLRNAFRANYGFGFVYDRNFGNREFSLSHPLGPFGIE